MTTDGSKLRVHRRSLRLDGTNYTVLSPRTDDPARFATGLFDDTWHIVTGTEGARMVARYAWAMSYQHHDHTLLVIDQRFLVPDPFTTDQSLPIAIMNRDLGPLSTAAVAALRTRLTDPSPSEGTVTLQTRGLDHALTERATSDDPAGDRRWIEDAQGCLVVGASPEGLREWALLVHRLSQRSTTVSDFEDPQQAKANRDGVLVLGPFP